MKLNLDKQLVTLKGEPTNEKLSEILANILAMAVTKEPAKMLTWAVNLYNYGFIEIDKEEVQFIKKIIENNETYVDLARAQVIEELEKLEF